MPSSTKTPAQQKSIRSFQKIGRRSLTRIRRSLPMSISVKSMMIALNLITVIELMPMSRGWRNITSSSLRIRKKFWRSTVLQRKTAPALEGRKGMKLGGKRELKEIWNCSKRGMNSLNKRESRRRSIEKGSKNKGLNKRRSEMKLNREKKKEQDRRGNRRERTKPKGKDSSRKKKGWKKQPRRTQLWSNKIRKARRVQNRRARPKSLK